MSDAICSTCGMDAGMAEYCGRVICPMDDPRSELKRALATIQQVREYLVAIPDSTFIADDGYPSTRVDRPDRIRDDLVRILDGGA